MASTYSELTYLGYTGAVDNSGNGVRARFDFQGVDRGAQFIANATWSVSMSNSDGPMCFIATNNQEVSGVTAKILTSAYESQVASGTLEMYPLTAGTTYRLQAYDEGGTPEVDVTFTPELNNNPKAKDLASGTLASSISASTTSLSVYVGEGSASTIKAVWPDTPFYVTLMPASPSAGVPNSLDSEIVKVTAVGNDQVGNTTLTVVRGQKGTTTKAFSESDVVTNAIYAGDAVLLAEEETSETETPWIGTDDIKDGAITDDKINWESMPGALVKKVILYSGATTGSVTLSDSVVNYDYILIRWKTSFNGTQYGNTLLSGGGNYNFSITANQVDWNGSSKLMNTANYLFNNNVITYSRASSYNNQNSNQISIIEVVGIKVV